MNTSKNLDTILFIWYILFFVSTICCFRAISSISIGLILVTGLTRNKADTGSWLNSNLKNGLLLSCCLFFLLDSAGMLFTMPLRDVSTDIQLKTAIVLVPLALCCCTYMNDENREKLMKWFIAILAAVLLYCIAVACYKYSQTGESKVFFYHELVSPFKQHAIQLSIYLFMGLTWLLEKLKQETNNKIPHFLMLVFLTGCILLLSSKLVIAFTVACFIYYFILSFRSKTNTKLIILTSFLVTGIIILVLATQNKISTRFNEIRSGDLELILQKNFDPGIYFNGVQLRLLEGRFVKEILTEKDAWILGVSDSAQALLDQKYSSTRMYIGDGITAGNGYLGYNTHNQFLESLLRSGISGLFVFALICYALIRMCIQRKNRELTLTAILLLVYCFNESVFETQYGIILFTFFPLFLYYGTVGKAQKHHFPQ